MSEENLTAGTPVETVAGSPAGSAGVSTGASNQNGEASQSATESDSFIPQGVDINTLPPSVRAMVDKINKDMVRGFTEKTSKLSETIKSESAKAAEAFKSKAEQYDMIAQQEEFVKQWNDYVQKSQAAGTPAQEGDPVLSQMKQQIEQMNQKIQMSELSQVTESFADAVNDKGEKIHPDFDKLNDFSIGKLQNGQNAEEYSLLRACVELSPGKSPQEKLTLGYKAAKELHDKIFEEGRKAGMGRIQAKVMNGTVPPSMSNADVLTVTDKKPKNAQEALAMAKRGQVVSRD